MKETYFLKNSFSITGVIVTNSQSG